MRAVAPPPPSRGLGSTLWDARGDRARLGQRGPDLGRGVYAIATSPHPALAHFESAKGKAADSIIAARRRRPTAPVPARRSRIGSQASPHRARAKAEGRTSASALRPRARPHIAAGELSGFVKIVADHDTDQVRGDKSRRQGERVITMIARDRADPTPRPREAIHAHPTVTETIASAEDSEGWRAHPQQGQAAALVPSKPGAPLLRFGRRFAPRRARPLRKPCAPAVTRSTLHREARASGPCCA